MARYIDADKIGIGFANPDVFENKSYAEGWNSAVEIIMKQPTADVQEVRHGKWNKNGNGRDCSICGFKYYANGGLFNFCPKCGAKMDGKEDEE